MCTSVLNACMVYITCAWGPQRAEEGCKSTRTGVRDGYKQQVSAGNQTKVSARRVNTHNHLSCFQP